MIGIKNLEWWWEYLKNLFNSKTFTCGSITLSPGLHEIGIPTQHKNPIKVYLSIEEPDDAIPTCVGNLNWVTAKFNPHGFTLYADIKTRCCLIEYIIEYTSERK